MHADFFCSSTIGPDYNPGSQQFCIIIFPETLFFSSTLSSNFFFFYQDFLTWTLKTHRTAGEGRGLSFIPLYHFHSLKNIQSFICNFACEMAITYFQSHHLYLPDCYLMRFTTLWNYHLTD